MLCFVKNLKETYYGIGQLPGIRRDDAYTNDADLPDVGVHYWLDAGTRLKYTLKVWVED